MAAERALLDGEHTVLTPEYVEFNFVLAGLYTRFLAWLLDSIIAVVIALALITAASLATVWLPGVRSAQSVVIWFLIDWGYAILLESLWSGQTLGKRALGLRVIQESGVRVTALQAVLRNLTRPLDRLPLFYAVGGVSALFSESQQRLGDMVAGTIVVRERRLKIPASISRPDGETTLLQDPVFQQRVARLTAEEAALVFNATLRREELGMDARLSLFSALSRRLQDDAGLFKPDHLSDEKLVLLTAAALAAREKERALRTGRVRGKSLLQK